MIKAARHFAIGLLAIGLSMGPAVASARQGGGPRRLPTNTARSLMRRLRYCLRSSSSAGRRNVYRWRGSLKSSSATRKMMIRMECSLVRKRATSTRTSRISSINLNSR